MKNPRGDAMIVLVLVLGGAALLGFTKPWKLLTHRPPIKELADAQEKVAEANTRAAAAQAEADRLRQEDSAKQQQQIAYAQAMVHGAGTALAAAPDSPEVGLAREFTLRADAGLEAAVGKLDPAVAKEIDDAFHTAMASKDHEIEVLRGELQSRDTALAQASADRDRLKVALPVAQEAADSAKAVAAAAQQVADTRQQQVNAYAAKAAAADQASFGWEGLANGLKRTLYWGSAIVLGLWAVKDLILPSLAQEYPGSSILQHAYRAVTSLTSAHQISPTKIP